MASFHKVSRDCQKSRGREREGKTCGKGPRVRFEPGLATLSRMNRRSHMPHGLAKPGP